MRGLGLEGGQHTSGADVSSVERGELREAHEAARQPNPDPVTICGGRWIPSGALEPRYSNSIEEPRGEPESRAFTYELGTADVGDRQRLEIGQHRDLSTHPIDTVLPPSVVGQIRRYRGAIVQRRCRGAIV